MTLTLETLARWEESGAQWRVVDISADRVVVDLCTCTGEAVDRMQSEDPEIISRLRRVSPEDGL